MTNIIKEISKKVYEFTSLITCPKLQISEPYYIYKEYREGYNEMKKWPNSDSPGVYIFLAGDKILYIGMSIGYMGNRIWSHIGRLGKKSKSEDEYPNAEEWIKGNKTEICFVTVAFPIDKFWLVPALESFLIDKFKGHPTLINRVGR